MEYFRNKINGIIDKAKEAKSTWIFVLIFGIAVGLVISVFIKDVSKIFLNADWVNNFWLPTFSGAILLIPVSKILKKNFRKNILVTKDRLEKFKKTLTVFKKIGLTETGYFGEFSKTRYNEKYEDLFGPKDVLSTKFNVNDINKINDIWFEVINKDNKAKRKNHIDSKHLLMEYLTFEDYKETDDYKNAEKKNLEK